MTHTATKREVRDDYWPELVAGQGMDLSNLKMRPTVEGVIFFYDANGEKTRALSVGSYYASGTAERSLRAKMNIQVGRLRSYRKANGERWEVVQEREKEEARAKKKAEAQARALVREAAPDLLAALQACALEIYMQGQSRKLTDAEQAALDAARAAISKANGEAAQ